MLFKQTGKEERKQANSDFIHGNTSWSVVVSPGQIQSGQEITMFYAQKIQYVIKN